MLATEATKTAVARDRKNVEETSQEGSVSKSFRAPVSVARFLKARPEGITEYVLEAVELKRDLDELLAEIQPDLVRIAALDLGVEYTNAQAAVLAHVVKRCLSKSKK